MKRSRAALILILAGGALLRVLYVLQVGTLPFFDNPVGDSAVYLARAADIAGGQVLPHQPFFYGSIFYPYLLAGLVHGVGLSVVGVCLVQAAAGVILAFVLSRIATLLYGVSAGLITAALTVLYGPFAFLEADVLGVVWGLLALAVALLLCLRWANDAGHRLAIIAMGSAGLCLGLAITERPNLVVLVPLVAAWIVYGAGRRRAIRPAVAFMGGAGIPVALVLFLNVAGSGQWVPLTTSGGFNLSVGYHSGADGTYEEPWEKAQSHFAARHTDPEESSITVASQALGRALTPGEASGFWGRKAVAYILSHPSQAALLTLRKVGLLLNATEIPNHLNYQFIRDHAPALRLMPIGFGLILPLGIVGLTCALQSAQRRRQAMLLLLITVGAMASVVPFFVADRYRAAMVLPLLVAAGGGTAALFQLIRDHAARAHRQTRTLVIAALVGVTIAALPIARPLKGRDYWMLAQAYEKDGDLQRAIAAYEAAVREEATNGPLLNNLALAYRRAGDRDKAIAALRRAIAADSTLAFPRKNLGMLLIGTGAMDQALWELRASLVMEPNDAEALGAVAALLAERGDTVEALDLFNRARRLAPHDARLLSLSTYYFPSTATSTPVN